MQDASRGGAQLAVQASPQGQTDARETLCVAIASGGRESLLRTLDSIAAQRLERALTLKIAVADDSTDGATTARVNAWLQREGANAPPVATCRVGARNIAIARNACLDLAGDATYLAFIDDDEWAAPDWLERMVRALDAFDADAVVGPVFPHYPADTPAWLVAANPMHVPWGKRGRVLTTGRTSNVLMRYDGFRRAGLTFDERLGRTGGEDTAYFYAAHCAGLKLVATDDAKVFERVPAARLQRRYLKTRMLRAGQTYAQLMLSPQMATQTGGSGQASQGHGGDDHRGHGHRGLDHGRLGRSTMWTAWRLVRFGDALGKCALAYALSGLLRPLDRGRALRMRMRAWLNRGKVRHFIGAPLPEMYGGG